jgi:hypothetical protein
MATVADMVNGNNLVPGVVPKMRYRSSVAADAPRWIVSAIRNITDDYAFEELSIPGPQVTLTAGLANYPISTFTTGSVKVTRFDSFVLWLNQFAPFTSPPPQNAVSLELKWRAMKTVKAYTSILGQPMYYTIYSETVQNPGSAQVWIAFNPNNSYLCQASYQEKHPFTDGVSDTIRMPDAWLEIVACAAAEIGAQENAMTDILQLMRINLYGDPDDPRQPGLIKKLVTSRAQFSNVNERQITFISGER